MSGLLPKPRLDRPHPSGRRAHTKVWTRFAAVRLPSIGVPRENLRGFRHNEALSSLQADAPTESTPL